MNPDSQQTPPPAAESAPDLHQAKDGRMWSHEQVIETLCLAIGRMGETPYSAELIELARRFPFKLKISMHEAGHAAATVILGRHVKMISIDENDGKHAGMVWSDADYSVEGYLQDLVIYAAGVAADELYGFPRGGDIDDLHITETARKLHGLLDKSGAQWEEQSARRKAARLVRTYREQIERFAVLMLRFYAATVEAPFEMLANFDERWPKPEF